MDRPWLNSYPEGVNADIDIKQHGPVVELFEQCVQ